MVGARRETVRCNASFFSFEATAFSQGAGQRLQVKEKNADIRRSSVAMSVH